MKILDEGLAAQLDGKWQVYDAATVRSAWQAVSDYNHIQLLQIDEHYRALARADWQTVMQASDTRTLKYQKDWRDCDDFSMLFCGEVKSLLVNGIGWMIDFSARHSFCMVLVAGKPKPEFAWIEPQADSWIIPNSASCYNLKGQGLCIL